MAQTVGEMALQFSKEMERARCAAEGFKELVDSGITDYETMRVLFVNQFKITMGSASDLVELLEKMTGITLER